jgi:hypothetical protein
MWFHVGKGIPVVFGMFPKIVNDQSGCGECLEYAGKRPETLVFSGVLLHWPIEIADVTVGPPL